MNKLCLFTVILCITLVIVGCSQVLIGKPTTTPITYPKQPVPQGPLIQGHFWGLTNDAIVTIHIRTISGKEVQWGTRRGDGPWESIVPTKSGMDYVITAEADGYVSDPISYTIHIDRMMAFLVEDGQVTTSEALHLNFHFVPVISITPTK